MCPLCLSTFVWLALGGGTAASAAALLAGFHKKGTNDGRNGEIASDHDA